MKPSRALFGIALLCSLSSGCAGDRNVIRVAADESSIERQVGMYLQSQGLAVQLVTVKDGSDSALVFDFAADESTPEFRMGINTKISAGEPGAVKGRVLVVSLLSHLKVRPEQLNDVLTVLNHHHATVWAGCFYVNEQDGELEAQWPIDVKSDYTVAVQQVEDAVQRLIQSYSVLFPQLAARLNGSVKTASR